jgi:hypothetical protein
MEVWEVRADAQWGHIYVRYRDEDFGRIPLPGLWVESLNGERREFKNLDAAFRHIRKLHDQRLKGTS